MPARSRTLLLVALAAATGGLALATAVPASTAAPTPAPAPAYVRAAHLVPDLPAMDVSLLAKATSGSSSGAAPLLTIQAAYGDVGSYAPLAAGSYRVELRPAGAPASSAPILTGTFDAVSGHAYTGAGVGTAAKARLAFFEDDLSAPGDGKARIRVINAARGADPVDVTAVSGPVVTRGVKYATATTYATVPAQQWKLDAKGGSLQGATTTTLKPNAVYSLLVLEGDSGLTVKPVLDASGAGTLPVGGAATGFGGTARATGPDLGTALRWGSAAACAGLLVAASAGVVRTRGRRPA